MLSDLRTEDGESSIIARLERAEKVARTKSTLCELLAAQLQQREVRTSQRNLLALAQTLWLCTAQ